MINQLQLNQQTKEEILIDKIQALVIDIHNLHVRLDRIEEAIKLMTTMNKRVIDILAGTSDGT